MGVTYRTLDTGLGHAKERKSVLLEKRAEGTYAEYRGQKVSESGGR
jgi:hypothetical protein